MEDWGIYNPNSLSVGIYHYTVIDTNGCFYNDSITINEPSPLTINLNSTNLSCYNSCDGEIIV